MSTASVMDFPEAWEFIKTTRPAAHDGRCSWIRTRGSLLCDCHVLDAEYARRKLPKPPRTAGYRAGGF